MLYTGSESNTATNMLVAAVVGAAAGATAVWAMDRLDWFAYNHEPEEVRRRTIEARPGGNDPAHVIANKIAGVAGGQNSQPSPAGLIVHYSLGVAPGALYGALYETVPALSSGRGSLFGLGLFLLQDEGVNAIANLSGSPKDYPWQAHARGLLGHIVYGVVTDTIVRGFLARRAERG